jgi:hypothetical protein
MTTPGSENPDYSHAMDKLNTVSTEAKIVGEELEEFFARCRERINELPSFVDSTISSTDMNESIKKIMAFRLGYPIAKSLTMLPREPNPWNIYVKDNFQEKMEDICSDETRGLSIYYDLITR